MHIMGNHDVQDIGLRGFNHPGDSRRKLLYAKHTFALDTESGTNKRIIQMTSSVLWVGS